MATAEQIRTQIEELTADLISIDLCVDQNFPTLKAENNGIKTIGFGTLDDLSITLKNIAYADVYESLRENRSYNIRLIDGGVLQMLYTFEGAELIKHRLAFFPSPDLLEYQNNSDVYENDEMYGDVIFKSVVTSPVRFDFDRAAFIDYDHPMSHVTFGQYKNCRIPATGALSPFRFVHFILRAFYNTPFKKFCGDIREHQYSFPPTITASESKYVHIQTGAVAQL